MKVNDRVFGRGEKDQIGVAAGHGLVRAVVLFFVFYQRDLMCVSLCGPD